VQSLIITPEVIPKTKQNQLSIIILQRAELKVVGGDTWEKVHLGGGRGKSVGPDGSGGLTGSRIRGRLNNSGRFPCL